MEKSDIHTNDKNLELFEDNEIYLVKSSFSADGTSALYFRPKNSKEQLKLHKIYDEHSWSHPWCDRLNESMCRKYGQKITIEEVFADLL